MVCVDPDALASIYSTWAQSEELLDEESELIELNQQLDLFGDFLNAVTPERARLDEFLPPVGNQGGKGSCASWAVGYGMRGYQAAAQRGFWSPSTDHLLSPTYDASKSCLPLSMTCDPTKPYEERVVWQKDTAQLNGTYRVRLSNGRANVEVPAQLTVHVNDRVLTSRAISSPGTKGKKSEAIEFSF